MTPDHINPIQWHQAQSVSRQTCARVFRDGGSPRDALAAFSSSQVSSSVLVLRFETQDVVREKADLSPVVGIRSFLKLVE